MNFDSAFFITCFLPVFAVVYCLLRGSRAKNAALLVGSLLFYAFGRLSGVLLLLAVTAVNYGFGLWIRRAERGKAPAALAVILDLLFLGAFKYLDFALAAVLPLLSAEQSLPGLAAPVGISFFTFKCISYVLDTYRDREKGTDSFFRLLLYVSFFPQLMAGPITRFDGFDAQLDAREITLASFAGGLRRFILGLGKKLFLAAAAARVADGVFGAEAAALDIRLGWLGAAAYTLQIFFDFSGYSDMAIGLGNMFGFAAPENFDYPYTAVSVSDFWRRWHISLSTWFRDYLYIPLGGNRRGPARAALNKLIVFALCGLWHGAAWTFVVWGLWHGLLSALESLQVIPAKRLSETAPGRVVARVYTLLAVCLGFVVFRADSFAGALRIFSAMSGAFPVTTASTVLLHRLLSAENVCLLLLSAVLCAPVGKRLGALTEGRLRAVPYALSAALLVLCLTALAAGGFTPFIYFQF